MPLGRTFPELNCSRYRSRSSRAAPATTDADLVAAGRQLATTVRADSDVRRASVGVSRDPTAGGVVLVTFDVVPSFDASPFRLEARVVAYPDEGTG